MDCQLPDKHHTCLTHKTEGRQNATQMLDALPKKIYAPWRNVTLLACLTRKTEGRQNATQMLDAQPKKIYAHNRNNPVGMQTKHPQMPRLLSFLSRPQKHANSLKERVCLAQTLSKTENLLQNCPSGLTDASMQALSATIFTPVPSTDCRWTK